MAHDAMLEFWLSLKPMVQVGAVALLALLIGLGAIGLITVLGSSQ